MVVKDYVCFALIFQRFFPQVLLFYIKCNPLINSPIMRGGHSLLPVAFFLLEE